jgi:hypothetical protein
MTSVDLPPPLTPVTQVKTPSGMSASTFCRLLPRAPRTPIALLISAALFGDRDFAAAGEIGAGDRVFVLLNLIGRAFGDDVAAVNARGWAHVDDVVGGEDGFFVVFDDEHRIAEIAQADQRFEQPRVVALVQADADGSSST